MIYHIVKKKEFRNSQKDGQYHPASLEEEGFIHCSTGEEIENTANTYYKGENSLYLLVIDESRVKQEIRYEQVEGRNQSMPHIMGPLNIDAILDKIVLMPDKNGQFEIKIEES